MYLKTLGFDSAQKPLSFQHINRKNNFVKEIRDFRCGFAFVLLHTFVSFVIIRYKANFRAIKVYMCICTLLYQANKLSTIY